MDAFELRSYDGPRGLHRAMLSEPQPASGEVLVRVHAIGVNYPDLLLTQGRYQLRPDLPTVPGCELAGEVVTTAAGSTWSVGDRVAAFVWRGAFAEFAVVPERSLLALPDEMSYAVGAAMAVNGHTALFALQRRGRLDPGSWLLVLGAAGGIGTAALQIGRGLGARTIGVVSREDRSEVAREAGAEAVVVARDGFATEVRELTGGAGVDVVLDPVGDWLFDEALRTLAPGGRLLVVGFAAGRIPEVAVNRLLLRNVAVVGAAYGAYADLEPDLPASQQETLSRMFAEGSLAPLIARTYPFADLPDALADLGSGAIRGKAIVHVNA